MASKRSYYDLLGVPRDADAPTIEAAYHGRSLRFRVGLFDDRPRDSSGPTRAEIETAYATLRDPEQRSRYDAELFGLVAPQAAAPARKPWLPWAIAGLLLLLVALAAAGLAFAASRKSAPRDPVSRILGSDLGARATLTARAVAVAASLTPVRAADPATTPAAIVETPSAPPTQRPAAVAAATSSPFPTITMSPSALATSTATATPSVTATLAPTATSPPEIATPTIPTMEPPTVMPTPAPPPFPATDRIGTATPVNLREGPGTNFASLGTLPRGTLLAATGAARTVEGVLWREFRLEGGAHGWVRDMDVLPVP